MLEGVIPFRGCGKRQGGLKYVRKVFQLNERCDGHVGGVIR